MQPPLQGVVLLTFGTGNLPSYLREEIRSACLRGIIIVNVSQCISGPVTDEYVLAKVTTLSQSIAAIVMKIFIESVRSWSVVWSRHDPGSSPH